MSANRCSYRVFSKVQHLLQKQGIKSSRGQALVEFAFILLLFLILIFGIIEFSIIMYNKALITGASREGARAAVLYGCQCDPTSGKCPYSPMTVQQIKDAVTNYLGNALLSFDDSDKVTVDVVTNQREHPLTVTVTFPYTPLVLAKLTNFSNGKINLSSTAIMRVE